MKIGANFPAKTPEGPIEDKWTSYKNKIDLVNPANKRLIDIIVVGTGLAGGSAAASLAELGYNVKAFCFQDSPRRAHSIAAQGGINASKNYMGDGDSDYRLFYDTVKGGVITELGKRMFIAWQKYQATSSISVLHRVSLLLEIMGVCWTIALLVAFWSLELFMPKVKPDNNCY